ncbi:MAG: exodeoxyribonuclease [Pseudomonadota bacterium]|jgi:exodeoxyribonuclease-3
MRIITFNANGIRSAATKGFFTWLSNQQADVVCIQETKAQIQQLSDPIFHPQGYDCFYHDAVKKGYSGVALYCKKPPIQVNYGIGWQEMDNEGRFIEAQWEKLSVISLYLPSGSSGELRQQFKMQLLAKLLPYLQQLAKNNRAYIIAGDWNIAHRNIDLKNWRSNQKTSGFLPEERAWLDQFFADENWYDGFRVINSQAEQYTWWSNRGQAWAKNVGWRIDYQMINRELISVVRNANIYTQQRFSDHAPLIMDYDYEII